MGIEKLLTGKEKNNAKAKEVRFNYSRFGINLPAPVYKNILYKIFN